MNQENHKLNENSLGLGESIIMGVAGTAPAYSIAATTGILFASIGLLSIASLIYSAVVMFGVTLAFHHLNRILPHAGASYAWVGEVFHPILGFFAGWSLLVASAVFMVSGTIPAAVSTLALLNPEKVNDPMTVSLVAAGWLALVTAILIKGIKLSSYFQVILTCIEVLFLSVIIIGSLWMFSSHPVQPFEWNQLSLSNFTLGSFATGALISLFFFWGWDVTVNLSEETKESADNPGKGAIGAMFIAMALFTSFIIAIQFAFSKAEIEHAGANLIFALAEKVFPKPWSYMAVIAVMLSTVGTLETTILQFTRTMFAKGRSGILNPRYARLHKQWKTPWVATLLIFFIGLTLLFLSNIFPTVNRIIEISVKSIGLQVAFYYGLACFACAWGFRKLALKNVTDFFLLLIWPAFSGLFLTIVFIYCAKTFSLTTTLLGIGGIALGAIPLYFNRIRV